MPKAFLALRFGVTARGYMCLVPEMSRPGDIASIIRGVKLPVVLRSTVCEDAELKPYELLGEAYVHGMMEGEACSRIEKYQCKFGGKSEVDILETASSILADTLNDVEGDTDIEMFNKGVEDNTGQQTRMLSRYSAYPRGEAHLVGLNEPWEWNGRDHKPGKDLVDAISPGLE